MFAIADYVSAYTDLEHISINWVIWQIWKLGVLVIFMAELIMVIVAITECVFLFCLLGLHFII